MVRRTIRPFTVEVRGSRRKPSATGFDGAEQPRVVWPEALLEGLNHDPQPEIEPAAAPKPSGRILPALAEPPRLARDPDPIEPEEEPPVRPVRQVHVLPDPEPPADTPEFPDTEDAPPRQRRAREPRAALARGERWKARLPAVVHRAQRKLRDRNRD